MKGRLREAHQALVPRVHNPAVHLATSGRDSTQPCEHIFAEKFSEEMLFEAALRFAVPKVTASPLLYRSTIA